MCKFLIPKNSGANPLRHLPISFPSSLQSLVPQFWKQPVLNPQHHSVARTQNWPTSFSSTSFSLSTSFSSKEWHSQTPNRSHHTLTPTFFGFCHSQPTWFHPRQSLPHIYTILFKIPFFFLSNYFPRFCCCCLCVHLFSPPTAFSIYTRLTVTRYG